MGWSYSFERVVFGLIVSAAPCTGSNIQKRRADLRIAVATVVQQKAEHVAHPVIASGVNDRAAFSPPFDQACMRKNIEVGG